MSAPIRAERRDDVLELTLDAPPRNILTTVVLDVLRESLAAAREPGLRALVLRAEGKAFSAGADVKEHLPDRVEAMLGSFAAAALALFDAPVPTIALVDGAALGAGCELALLCDFVIATERATFGQPEIALGALAPVAAALLPAIVGAREAARLILDGTILSASEAKALGIASEVAPDLGRALDARLAALRRSSPAILGIVARAQRAASFPFFASRLRALERTYLAEVAPQPDAEEGLRAFLDKRKPRWAAGAIA